MIDPNVRPEADAECLRRDESVPHVVVVDPDFTAYRGLAEAARRGAIHLHLRSSGAAAIKLARKLRVDAWLVGADLDDISGADFVELLKALLGPASLAIVGATTDAGSKPSPAERAAEEAGIAAVLEPPITLADVERLLGMRPEERHAVLAEAMSLRSLVAVPMGVSAAAVAIAVLMLG